MPNRSPDGFRALLSPGMVFLLTTMLAISNIRLAVSPMRGVSSGPNIDLQSRLTKWVFVPPKGTLIPS